MARNVVIPYFTVLHCRNYLSHASYSDGQRTCAYQYMYTVHEVFIVHTHRCNLLLFKYCEILCVTHIVTDKEPVLISICIQYTKCSLFILIDVICYCLHTKSVIMKFKSDIYI